MQSRPDRISCSLVDSCCLIQRERRIWRLERLFSQSTNFIKLWSHPARQRPIWQRPGTHSLYPRLHPTISRALRPDGWRQPSTNQSTYNTECVSEHDFLFGRCDARSTSCSAHHAPFSLPAGRYRTHQRKACPRTFQVDLLYKLLLI